MTTKKFSNALGNIGEAYIAESVTYTAKPEHTLWTSGVFAACFAAILIAAAVIVPVMLERDAPPPSIAGTINTKPAEGKKYYDYSEIRDGIYTSYIRGNTIAEDRIGSKIDEVAVTAGWKNEEGEWISTQDLNTEVYSIDGVESDIAVALKLVDESEATTRYYVIMHPNAEYNGMEFPDYIADNPVRYLEESLMGKANGWQDLGLAGEIRTITTPVGSTYIYQMYSYYIRNDLRHIYWNETLPDKLSDLPAWLSDTNTAGRRSFWYSMGNRIPENISLETTATISSENGAMEFIKAEYKVQLNDSPNEKEENWVIYFMEEDGIYSAYAVIANENFDSVKSYTESIVKSYQKKQ